ncbi:septal ring lytic transglycosylase RlpA family protein [Geomobilimonas luticola]|uniref:Probable endolytic peptidoglycan transglycosylase RlpA n=1 Tax=Geomobilimonas luticola TaxID=1114878 RepID=A0ABS5S822_9BACT|nr:septal ring lytic transglycosylase RlpA family protein [Geomobilimonas luticola]MBT0651516.1 septal ring lytic transglycosylase RlpA family protein [Geomobilimonas luticola]
MATPNPRGRLALIVFLCQLALMVHTLPLQADETKTDSNQAEITAPAEGARDGMVGIASYYAKRYNGRRTNSGVRYNPEKLTAAHQDLPHGTRVKVINLANDKEVVVTVNDRCRKRSRPFIDLSRAAARELGFLGKGVARVRIIVLADGTQESS